MAIVPMQKIRLYIHQKDTPDVLEAIQEAQVMELTSVQEDGLEKQEKKIFELNYILSRLDFAIEFLAQFEEQKKGKLRAMLEGDLIATTKKDIDILAKNFYFDEIVESLQNIEQNINLEKDKAKELLKEQSLLEDWEGLDMSLGKDLETQYTQTVFVAKAQEGVMQTSPKDTLEVACQKAGCAIYIRQVNTTHFVLTYMKEDEEQIKTFLQQEKLSVVQLEKRRGTPKVELERLGRARENTEKRIQKLQDKARSFVKYVPKLKVMSDYMLWKKQRHDVASIAPSTQYVRVFEGWCSKDAVKTVEQKIQQVTKRCILETVSPHKGEKAPVVLKNNALIRPFEVITKLYSLPAHKELDPTVFLAGFFFLFFGLCLTDFFYGLFIAAIAGGLLWRYTLPRDTKLFAQLMLYGGIASGLLGMLFAGYLGIASGSLPEWVLAMQLFDPMGNPLGILYLALILGFIQIFFGVFLKMMTKIKNGLRKDAFLDEGPWIVFFLLVTLLGLEATGFVANTLHEVWIICLYISLGSIVLTQGRKEKSIVKKLLTGVLSLYGIVGYFSDILSYSRLLALGLATTALAFAINLIAGIVQDMIPYIGTVLALLILVVGHVFNVMVNILGAFIHSMRLQFVEFFGKFMDGGGREMDVFEAKKRYVTIEK